MSSKSAWQQGDPGRDQHYGLACQRRPGASSSQRGVAAPLCHLVVDGLGRVVAQAHDNVTSSTIEQSTARMVRQAPRLVSPPTLFEGAVGVS